MPMRVLQAWAWIPRTIICFMGTIQTGKKHKLSALFDEGIDGLLNRLETLGSPNAQQFKDDFDNFVYEYGSRGPNEWELSAHTWKPTHPYLCGP